eukprot:1149530-Pelagomonas_calceolata.AAC.1
MYHADVSCHLAAAPSFEQLSHGTCRQQGILRGTSSTTRHSLQAAERMLSPQVFLCPFWILDVAIPTERHVQQSTHVWRSGFGKRHEAIRIQTLTKRASQTRHSCLFDGY